MDDILIRQGVEIAAKAILRNINENMTYDEIRKVIASLIIDNNVNN